MSEDDIRVTGKFYDQQRKVYRKYQYLRGEGVPIDNDWFGNEMTLICDRDMPPGYDPEKNKFMQRWKTNFCKRWRISVQKRTNRKNKDVHERIHLVKNYHYYTVYILGTEKP